MYQLKKIFLISLICSSSFFFSGTSYSNEDNFSNNSKIYIAREKGYWTMYFRSIIYLNGERLGKIKNGRKMIIENVQEGRNVLVVDSEEGKSGREGQWKHELVFNIDKGESKYFFVDFFWDGQEPSASAAIPLLGIFDEGANSELAGIKFLKITKDLWESRKGKVDVVSSTLSNQVNISDISEDKSEKSSKKEINSIENELTKLKDLFDKGLISKEVYEEKQKKLLGL